MEGKEKVPKLRDKRKKKNEEGRGACGRRDARKRATVWPRRVVKLLIMT